MKRYLHITFFCTLISVIAFSQGEPAIVGTWHLVSGNLKTKDSTINYGTASVNSMKIITPTHFANITQNVDGSFRRAAGGKVKFDNKNYTEFMSHGSSLTMIGKPSVFTYEVKGDRLHILGGRENMTFDEIWERVKD